MTIHEISRNFFYSNLEKVKQDAVWNDENQRWRIPDLITQKTKLPPAGMLFLKIFGLFLLIILHIRIATQRNPQVS